MRRLLAVLLLAASPALGQAKKLSDAACRLDGGAGCGGSGSGTVTSVAMSGGTTGFSFSGGPITTSGTFTLSGTLAVANGGTNATSASAARTSLGLAIGTDVQAFDADLGALAANSTNGLWGRTGAGTGAARTITGTANEVTLTNGDGVSGNPVVSLPSALTFTGKTVTGGTYSGATMTTSLNLPHSTTLPATCAVGDVYVDTDATAGQNTYMCLATDTWVLQGPPASVPPFADNSALVANSSDATKTLTVNVGSVTTGTNRTWTAPDANTSIPVIPQTITVTGPTAARTWTVPDASFTLARTDAGNTFTGAQTITGAVTLSGKVTTYNGVATAGDGLSATRTVYENTGLNAALGSTSIYTTPAADGYYRISFQLIITTVGTSGTISAAISWTDAEINSTVTTGGITGQVSVLGQRTGATTGVSWVKASTNITVQTIYNTVVGTPVYSYRVIVEKM